MVVYILLGIVIVLILLFFLPIKGKRYERAVPEQHIDERDTMFSRNEILPGEQRYKDYYAMRPENLQPDNNFRSLPGLLSEGTTYYNQMAFAAADASFEAVEAFFDLRSKNAGKGRRAKGEGQDPGDLALFIKQWAGKMGVHSIGIVEMRDYHFYSKAGRHNRYGKAIENNHKYGIAFTVEMDHELTSSGPKAAIVMESARQYLNAGMIATQLALTLRNLGFDATTHIDANYDVICPIVAKDAGLGEIGRMGLLMTPGLGPRVRIAVVTTDAELIPDNPVYDDTVIDFCTHCKKCAVVCPSNSISHNQRERHKGGLRWQINQEACFTYWCQAGTDCGRCMAVCPYSHKNNLLHNFVRWGISNNYFFRRLAIVFDDIIYGKKPKMGSSPDWLND